MNDTLMAFPQAQVAGALGLSTGSMTLRDYFAGQALAAVAAYGPNGHAPASVIADAAYEIADAMIAARNAGGEA